MNAGELYSLFRSDVQDIEAPYLWSDDEVYAYMNDAYYMFVRRMGGIADSTSTITRIPIVSGVATAEMSYRILKVRAIRKQSNNRPLRLMNIEDEHQRPMDDYGVNWNSGNDNIPGQVRYAVIGEQDDTVRWVQVPLVNDMALLWVFRLPLNEIRDEDSEFERAVHPYHHIHLLKWMRYMAYSKQDAETFNKIKATEAEAEFEAYCLKAKAEWERKKSKTRLVQYGGYEGGMGADGGYFGGYY